MENSEDIPTSDETVGSTKLADSAIGKVVALAARDVPGVISLGSAPPRAIGVIRDAVGAGDQNQGVRVERGEDQIAVDIELVAQYGTNLQELANKVRQVVYQAMQHHTDLRVTEVNVEILDVRAAEPDKPQEGIEMEKKS